MFGEVEPEDHCSQVATVDVPLHDRVPGGFQLLLNEVPVALHLSLKLVGIVLSVFHDRQGGIRVLLDLHVSQQTHFVVFLHIPQELLLELQDLLPVSILLFTLFLDQFLPQHSCTHLSVDHHDVPIVVQGNRLRKVYFPLPLKQPVLNEDLIKIPSR